MFAVIFITQWICFYKRQRLPKGIEEFEDTKEIIRIHKSTKNRQHNDPKKKDKQRSTKHYT